jgi:hypothetical protein
VNVKLSRSIQLAVCVCLVALGLACSRSRLTAVWENPEAVPNPYKRIAAVGITTSDANRRLFEDNIVRQLRDRGVAAEPSYPLVPDGRVSLNRLRPALQSANIDAILTTRVLGVDKDVIYIPGDRFFAPYYSRYDPYYFYSVYHPFTYDPGYLKTQVAVKLETNLYDAESGELIWSAQSKTIDPSSADHLAASVGPLLIEQLLEKKILEKRSETR